MVLFGTEDKGSLACARVETRSAWDRIDPVSSKPVVYCEPVKVIPDHVIGSHVPARPQPASAEKFNIFIRLPSQRD